MSEWVVPVLLAVAFGALGFGVADYRWRCWLERERAADAKAPACPVCGSDMVNLTAATSSESPRYKCEKCGVEAGQANVLQDAFAALQEWAEVLEDNGGVPCASHAAALAFRARHPMTTRGEVVTATKNLRAAMVAARKAGTET